MHSPRMPQFAHRKRKLLNNTVEEITTYGKLGNDHVHRLGEERWSEIA